MDQVEKLIDDFQGEQFSSRDKIGKLSAFSDRCSTTKCRDGETCILNKDGNAECTCTPLCEDPKDERLMVKIERKENH